MSLTGAVYKSEEDLERECNGEDEWIELFAAGPESYRRSFYGSKAVRDLRLAIIPSLRGGEIKVSGASLLELERGIQVIRDNIETIAQQTGGDAANYLRRLAMISKYVILAKDNGCVITIG